MVYLGGNTVGIETGRPVILSPIKSCTKCGEDKPANAEAFAVLNRSRDGLASWCRLCLRAANQRRREDPAVKERERLASKERRRTPEYEARKKTPEFLEACRARDRKRRANSATLSRIRKLARESARKRFPANKDEINKRRRERYRNDRAFREKVLARKKRNGREWWRKANAKRRSTVEGKINGRISARIWQCLKATSGGKQRRRWEALVGYSTDDLKAHLERQFVKGMSWENMGKWHIDHIVPLSSFQFAGPDDPEFRAAWALTNLRPLCASENIKKHSLRTLLL